MKILDLSAGNRAIWFDKHYRDATYIDIRPEVTPDVVADSRELPTQLDMDYTLVVFDPPHVNFGANAELSKTYGHHTTAEIRDIIAQTGREAHLFTGSDALMVFKWNDHDQKLATVLALLDPYWEPLFGHKTSTRLKHVSTTYWVLLRRREI